MLVPETLVRELEGIVGAGNLLGPSELAGRDPGVDAETFGAGLLVRPADTAQVAAVLVRCHAARIGVVPQGGRTGLSGGARSEPGQIIVSLERMTRILEVDELSRVAVVEAGVRLGALVAACAAVGLSPGIDFGARDSATVGGMLATNAGGVEAFRHGTTRDRVLGLTAVLADGTVLDELGRVRKRNEGAAVERLLIGAEGTLGIITRASLALVTAPQRAATALVAVPAWPAALGLSRQLLARAALEPLAVEFMSANHARITVADLGLDAFRGLCAGVGLVLVEVAGAQPEVACRELEDALQDAAARGEVSDALVAANESQRRSMWRLREDWAVDRRRPGGLWYDISVPGGALPQWLEDLPRRIAAHDAALEVFFVGHLADGNVHVTVNAPHPITARYEEIAALVTHGLRALGGSFSAEHGIGIEKKATLARHAGAAKLAVLRRVKDALDPHGIMNPGKVLPE